MNQVPILLLSDCPSQMSGLARVTRDLATLLASMPEFRVASLGAQGVGSSRLPFTQYHIRPDSWGQHDLPLVWDEHAQGEHGIVFTIFDLSRLLWLARPEYVEDEWSRAWLLDARARKFSLWSYVPVDATGPGNRLTLMSHDVLMGIDRVLAYSPFGRDVIHSTIGNELAEMKRLTWLPHPYNAKVFTPIGGNNGSVCNQGDRIGHNSPNTSDRVLQMVEHNEHTDVKRIGVVMTNQSRKEWGLAVTVCAALVAHFKGEVSLWFHIDQPVRFWNIYALLADFGLGEYVQLTLPPVGDQWLAEQYRACDLTLLPSLGEGFGYSWAESFACGTPCLHTDYAGGASLMSTCGLNDYLVPADSWRMEGQYNSLRPVPDPAVWVEKAIEVLERPREPELAKAVEHLGMMKLGHTWKKWFKEGLNEQQP